MPEPHYPKLLATIDDPPYLLFYRGELPTDSDLCLAIVGSRKATAYGREVASYLAGGLAKAGAWVVSGLARGIDSNGHRGALDAGGKTIGVLGCGIDVIYPRENRQLFADVAESGCIISEYPLGMQPLAKNFPVRNRIVSGLCSGVIVVEAGLRSGTQITVDYALEQGRDIYAVPGSIFSPASAGTHRLIRDYGVKLITSAQDVLEEYPQGYAFGGVSGQKPGNVQTTIFTPQPPALSADEQRLWDILVEQRHFNDLAAEMQMDTSSLMALLTICELRGFIKRLDGQYYIRSNV
jgi:DNA processing protein